MNNNLSRKEIIKLCECNYKKFKRIIKNVDYEVKGIFNSEMLMFVSIVKHLGVRYIKESGTGRGQSTKIISEFFKDLDYQIHSVEYNKYTKDSIIAMKRLHKYKNLKLYFGNAFDIVPKLITEKCCILIDGPKGDDAVKLAIKTLKNPLVSAVFIHDVHKDSESRNIIEKVFSQTFFSDDEEFVKTFKELDDIHWNSQKFKSSHINWGPYCRGKKIMKSYSTTLGVIFNGKKLFDERLFKEYMDNKKSSEKRVDIEKMIRRLLGPIRNALHSGGPTSPLKKEDLLIPYYFIMYHLNKLILNRLIDIKL